MCFLFSMNLNSNQAKAGLRGFALSLFVAVSFRQFATDILYRKAFFQPIMHHDSQVSFMGGTSQSINKFRSCEKNNETFWNSIIVNFWLKLCIGHTSSSNQ